jgi:hypothetical protein
VSTAICHATSLPTVEALPLGTDSLKSATTELKRLLKDFRDPKLDSAGIIDLTDDANDEVSGLLRRALRPLTIA